MRNLFMKEFKEVVDKQLICNGVSECFPKEIESLRRENLHEKACKNRVDLTNLYAFTIDNDDTKDMDDALSFDVNSDETIVGVHIADVSAYVNGETRIGTILENEAIIRGTSIYLPDRTIPMLPSVLSNDLCSLNPNENRNTLSVLIHLDNYGNVKSYEICKAVIRSRIKGKYSEVNHIINKNASATETQKYRMVINKLMQMRSMADRLRNKRVANGAIVSSNAKAKYVIHPNQVEIIRDNHGTAGMIVEEFMILANRLVAEYFVSNNLPGVYRIQKVIGKNAEYSNQSKCHKSLALENYFHYTSPIRRIADLIVHQILTAYLDGVSVQTIHEKYDNALEEICEYATKRSRRADNISYVCEKICAIKYYADKTKTRFIGEITGFNRNNRPIILIKKYNTKILGAVDQMCREGERYSLYVCVGKDALFASNMKKICA